MKRLIASIAVAVSLFAIKPAHADVIFTADGIPGTSLIAKPPAPNPVEATSFVFTAGKAADLVITRLTDKASVPLLSAAASSQRFKNVTVYFINRSDPSAPVLYRATLMDATLVSVKQAASDNDRAPTETLTFEFTRAEVETFVQDPKTGRMSSGGRATISGKRS